MDDKTSAWHVHPHHERRIYSQYLAPRSPPLAYLSAVNLLSQILSGDDRMDPPKGGPPHLGGVEHIGISASIINLGQFLIE